MSDTRCQRVHGRGVVNSVVVFGFHDEVRIIFLNVDGNGEFCAINAKRAYGDRGVAYFILRNHTALIGIQHLCIVAVIRRRLQVGIGLMRQHVIHFLLHIIHVSDGCRNRVNGHDHGQCFDQHADIALHMSTLTTVTDGGDPHILCGGKPPGNQHGRGKEQIGGRHAPALDGLLHAAFGDRGIHRSGRAGTITLFVGRKYGGAFSITQPVMEKCLILCPSAALRLFPLQQRQVKTGKGFRLDPGAFVSCCQIVQENIQRAAVKNHVVEIPQQLHTIGQHADFYAEQCAFKEREGTHETCPADRIFFRRTGDHRYLRLRVVHAQLYRLIIPHGEAGLHIGMSLNHPKNGAVQFFRLHIVTEGQLNRNVIHQRSGILHTGEIQPHLVLRQRIIDLLVIGLDLIVAAVSQKLSNSFDGLFPHEISGTQVFTGVFCYQRRSLDCRERVQSCIHQVSGHAEIFMLKHRRNRVKNGLFFFVSGRDNFFRLQLNARELAAIDFAVLVERNALNLHGGRGHHVAGQFILDESVHGFDIHWCVGNHIGNHTISAAGILLGDNRSILDAIKSADAALNLCQFHAEAADFHLEVTPANEVDRTVRQEAHHIAALINSGIQRIVGEWIGNEFFRGQVRAVQIAVRYLYAGYVQFSGNTHRRKPASSIHHIESRIVGCLADRNTVIQLIDVLFGTGNRTFRGTVDIKQSKFRRIQRHKRFAAHRQGAQCGDAHAFGKLPAQLCCHKCNGDFVFLKIPANTRQIQTHLLRQDMQTCPPEQGGIQIHHVRIKAKTSIGRNIVAFAELVAVSIEVEVIHNIGVSEHDSLGFAGGAGGVQQDEQILGTGYIFRRFYIRQCINDGTVHNEAGIFRHTVQEVAVANQHLRIRVLQHILQTVGRIAGIQRQISRTCFQCSQCADGHHQTTVDQDAHNTSATGAPLPQMDRQTVGYLVQLTIAQGLLPEHDRIVVGGFGRLFPKERNNRSAAPAFHRFAREIAHNLPSLAIRQFDKIDQHPVIAVVTAALESDDELLHKILYHRVVVQLTGIGEFKLEIGTFVYRLQHQIHLQRLTLNGNVRCLRAFDFGQRLLLQIVKNHIKHRGTGSVAIRSQHGHQLLKRIGLVGLYASDRLCRLEHIVLKQNIPNGLYAYRQGVDKHANHLFLFLQGSAAHSRTHHDILAAAILGQGHAQHAQKETVLRHTKTHSSFLDRGLGQSGHNVLVCFRQYRGSLHMGRHVIFRHAVGKHFFEERFLPLQIGVFRLPHSEILIIEGQLRQSLPMVKPE